MHPLHDGAARNVEIVMHTMCLWPSGKGAGLPPRTGGFDSRGALLKSDRTPDVSHRGDGAT